MYYSCSVLIFAANASRSISIPSSVMETFPQVPWAVKLVAIVTAVVGQRVWSVALHYNFTISWIFKSWTIPYTEYIYVMQFMLFFTVASEFYRNYFSVFCGILEPFHAKCHHVGIVWSMLHPAHIRSCRCSRLLRSNHSHSQGPCRIEDHQA